MRCGFVCCVCCVCTVHSTDSNRIQLPKESKRKLLCMHETCKYACVVAVLAFIIDKKKNEYYSTVYYMTYKSFGSNVVEMGERKPLEEIPTRPKLAQAIKSIMRTIKSTYFTFNIINRHFSV